MGLLLIGCGKWGRNHIRTLHEMGELTAVCDINVRATDSLPINLSKGEFLDIYKNYKNAFGRDDIEGVVIATPTETHLEIAKDVMDAGLPVLIEKPVAPSLGQFDYFLNELVPIKGPQETLCDISFYPRKYDAQRLLMLGHLTVYSPAFSTLRMLINHFETPIEMVNAIRVKSGSFRKEGALYGLGVHDLAMMEVLLGCEFDKINWKGGNTTQKNTFFVTGFHDKIRWISAVWSFLYPDGNRSFMIMTEKETYVLYEKEPDSIFFYPTQDFCFDIEKSMAEQGGYRISTGETKLPLRLELEHFLECVRNNKPFKTGLDHTYKVMKAVDKIERSMKNARVGNGENLGI